MKSDTLANGLDGGAMKFCRYGSHTQSIAEDRRKLQSFFCVTLAGFLFVKKKDRDREKSGTQFLPTSMCGPARIASLANRSGRAGILDHQLRGQKTPAGPPANRVDAAQ